MYNSALKSQPSDPTALLYRSFAHVLRSNPRLDLAAQDADSIIQLDPSNWKAWKQKGDVLRRQGDLQAAVDALTNAVGCAHGIDRMETQALLNTTQTLLAQQSDLPPPQNVLPQTPPAPLPNQAPPTVPTIPPTVLPERPKKVPETDPLPQRPLPQQQTAGSTSSQPATQSPVSNPSIAQEKPTQSRSTELDESEPAPAQCTSLMRLLLAYLPILPSHYACKYRKSTSPPAAGCADTQRANCDANSQCASFALWRGGPYECSAAKRAAARLLAPHADDNARSQQAPGSAYCRTCHQEQGQP